MPNMKQCPFCAEEVLVEAVKCRFCNEYFPRQRGFFGKITNVFSFILSSIIMIASAAYVAVTYIQDHGQHGHKYWNDPWHLLGLAVVVISAIVAWHSVSWRGNRQRVK